MLPQDAPRVHFVKSDLYRTWPDIDVLNQDHIDVNQYALRLRGGTNSWLVQTYLQLSKALPAAGVRCTIGESFVPGAINVAHRDTLSRFRLAYLKGYVLGLRADRAPLRMCDFEVVQNEVLAPTAERVGIPLWPQPGLLARAATRGSKVRTIGYFGRTGTVARWWRDEEFTARLNQLGVRFEIREDRWFDYSDVDIILAHRLEAPVMLEQKPPSKLINAWLAGTPALLGDEPAFVNLRRSPLDYISVDSPDDVVEAVTRLQREPGLFEAMADNGRRRAMAYNSDALRNRWLDLLVNRIIPSFYGKPDSKRIHSFPGLVKAYFEQNAATKAFRARYFAEREALRQRDSSYTD